VLDVKPYPYSQRKMKMDDTPKSDNKTSENFKKMVANAKKMVKDNSTEKILIPRGHSVTLGGVPFTVALVKRKKLILIPGAGYELDWDTPTTRKKYNYQQHPTKT